MLYSPDLFEHLLFYMGEIPWFSIQLIDFPSLHIFADIVVCANYWQFSTSPVTFNIVHMYLHSYIVFHNFI